MNKTELVEAVAKQRQISKGKATQALDVVLQTLIEALQRGDKVQIKGFGTFSVRERGGRRGRNPKTGEPLELPPSRSLLFKAAQPLLQGLAAEVAGDGPLATTSAERDDQTPTRFAQPPRPTAVAQPAPALSEERPDLRATSQEVPREQEHPSFHELPAGTPGQGPTPDLGRRYHPRAPIAIEVNYAAFDVFLADYAQNISRGGMFIRTVAPLPCGTELVFQLKLPGRAAPLPIKGKVAWTRPSAGLPPGEDPGMGIQFVHDSLEQQRAVETAVEALLDEHTASAAFDPTSRPIRYPVELKVEYQSVDQFSTEYARNISRGGLFIHSETPLPQGTEILFQLSIPLLRRPFPLKGRVAWRRLPDQAGKGVHPGMGIQFLFDSEEERLRLERVFHTLAKEVER